MLKKWMAGLLSVVLALGLSVPAIADDFSDSAESGDPEDITQLVFSKSSYTVAQGDELDLSQELTAYCGSKKICQYPDYEFSMDDSSLVFDITEDGVVTVWEEKGSATVTVEEITSGKKATCRVVATKGSGASSFKFTSSSYTVYTGSVEPSMQPKLIVEPVGGSQFTPEQKEAIHEGVDNFLTFATFEMEDGTGENEGKLIFIPQSVSDLSGTTSYSMEVEFPRANDSSRTSRKKVSLRVNSKAASEARRLGRKGSVRLEVGQTADLYDYVTYNSSANVGKDCTFYLDFYNDKADSADYAVLSSDGHTIKGVAVGRLIAVATLVSNSDQTVEIPVEVVAKGKTSSSTPDEEKTMSLSPATGNIPVGGTLRLTAENVPEESTVKWSLDNTDLASLTVSNDKATLKGLRAGIVTVTAEVDGQRIGQAKVKVNGETVSSDSENIGIPPTPVLPDIPIVTNPSTGDSWFSFLF